MKEVSKHFYLFGLMSIFAFPALAQPNESKRITINAFGTTNESRFLKFKENVNKLTKDKIEIWRYTTEGDPIISGISFNGSKIILRTSYRKDRYAAMADRIHQEKMIVSIELLKKAETISEFLVLVQVPNWQGTYWHHFGKTLEGAYHHLEIYHSDTATYFYIEIGRGAPSYNSGATYGRLTYNTKTGSYWYLPKDTVTDCRLEFRMTRKTITVQTRGGNCGYGGGVAADGDYEQHSKRNPESFTDREGKKIIFRNTPP